MRIIYSEYLKYCLGGIAAALSFPPFFIFPCFFLSLGWFFWKIYEEKSSKVLLKTLCYWFAFFVVNLYWLVIPLTFDIYKYWFLIPVAAVGAPIFLASYFCIPVYFMKKYGVTLFRSAVIFILCNFFMTYFFGKWFPGFPWLLPGYIWNFCIATMQSLSLWGIYGQSFITWVVGTLLGIALLKYKHKQKYYIPLGCAISIFIVLLIFGIWRLSNYPTTYTNYSARIVKVSINQNQKKKQRYQQLKTYLNYCNHVNGNFIVNPKKYDEQGHLDFIIWPEASVPYLFRDNFYELKKELSSKLFENEYLIAGAVRQDELNNKIYNSVIVMDAFQEVIGKYDKQHLVPFGEYIPGRKYIPETFQAVANTIGDFDVGTTSKIINLKGLKAVICICYEAVFPNEIIPPCEDGDVIINITNDSWFGYSSALSQHLQIVRARAVEEGLPLIRATGFGIAAVFDSCGREICSLPTSYSGVMDFYIPNKINPTVFSIVSRLR